MADQRVPLYERLPEIYRIRDEEQEPRGQLRHYLALVEAAFGAVHENIEALYRDLFIESCDHWVVPYIGDLLGTSHLAGDPWTLRADVADTIALRRRKGTLAAMERLTFNLTGWGVRGVELRENLAWAQHLNHQRPDAGGLPPYGRPGVDRFTPIRGGTATLRDPAMLSLRGTAFDPFAYVADLRPPAYGSVRYNLPNLAVFLWRLAPYRVRSTFPVSRGVHPAAAPEPDEATHAVRFDVHPLGRPVRLFNTYQFDPDRTPPVLTELDRTPGPIHRARLTEDSPAGNPQAYVAVDTYDPADPLAGGREIADVGLQLHLPAPPFTDRVWPAELPRWRLRGANLCAWEAGVRPRLRANEILVDPDIGRVVFGVGTTADAAGAAEAAALEEALRVTYTYGAPGPVGAHPVSRAAAPARIGGEAVLLRTVNFHADPNALRDALADLDTLTRPLVVEIRDSATHRLDPATVTGTLVEDGGPNLLLNRPLVIRAASGQRPVVALTAPLRFRPLDAAQARGLSVRLEGLYLSRDESSFPVGSEVPLIARAALDRLEILDCTLDPGGQLQLDGTRAPLRRGLALREPYGFDPAEEAAFDQTPTVVVQRSVTGALLLDRGYQLALTDTIVDAGAEVGEPAADALALASASDPAGEWGPPTQFGGLTLLGRARVESIDGRGGVFVQRLEVLDDQRGCIRYSYFSGDGDRLPQNLGCVHGPGARLRFSDSRFGAPGYARLHHASDFRIRERGPDDDAMGAYGFLREAHRWRNLRIRYREFMPLGVRPLLIPVT